MKKIVLVLSILLLFAACDFNGERLERIKVSGEVTSISDSFDAFNEIVIAGPFDVVIEQNGGSDIDLETYESLFELFRAEVMDDALVLYILDTAKTKYVDIEESYDHIASEAVLSGSRLKWPDNEKVLNLTISYDLIDKIKVIGESTIKTEGDIRCEKLTFEVAGALSLDAEIYADAMQIELAGAGNLDMRGEVEALYIECAGAGTIKAYDLVVNSADLDIAGVCNARIHVLERIDAEVAGVGTIKYKGSPSIINYDKAGLGSLKPAEEEDEKDNTEI